MSSTQKNSRAGALLAEIRESDNLSIERLALLVGVSPDDLRACRENRLVLPPVIQARLAQVIASRVPRLAGHARRLGEQAAAAASVQEGATALHLTAPAKWW